MVDIISSLISDIWTNRVIVFIALLACLTALYSITRIVKSMEGYFKKGFSMIGWGVFFITIRVISLNLVYWNLIKDSGYVTLITGLFTVLSTVSIAIGVTGLSRVIEFMPKGILREINESSIR